VRNREDDRDLRALFSRLRAEDRAAVAPFETLLGKAEQRRRKHTPARAARHAAAIAAALVLLAAAALAVLDQRRGAARREPTSALAVRLDLRSTWWEAPTDFLLDTPGDRLLRTVPAFGWSDDWGLPPADARRPPSSPTRHDGRPTS